VLIYFESLRDKYHLGNKKIKGAILEQVCLEEGCHRKHAIRLLRRASCIEAQSSEVPVASARRGRRSKYGNPEVCQALRKLWRVTNWMGSKALKASIPVWLPYYERHYGEVSEDTRKKLHEISPATIDRLYLA
jgi:hypothetical protein